MAHSFNKLENSKISDVPSTGSTTRSLVRLTGNHDQLPKQREQLIDNLCHALSVRFAETETEGVLKATSLANFKLWPADETELQGVYIGIVLIFACIRIFLITYFLCIYHFYFSCMLHDNKRCMFACKLYLFYLCSVKYTFPNFCHNLTVQRFSFSILFTLTRFWRRVG